MKKIKISILLVSSSILDEFKSSQKCDFWEEISKKVTSVVSHSEVSEESPTSFQHHFYVTTDATPDNCKQSVTEAIASMLPEGIDIKNIIVSVSLENQGASGGSIMDKLASLAKSKLSESEKPNDKEVEVGEVSEKKDDEVAAVEKEEPAASDTKEKENKNGDEKKQEEDFSLFGRAKKLKEIKDELLNTVEGQRHAIDEVVQTVFEMEMFSKNNPKRKGPLATFLFTGPSGVGKTFLAEQLGERLNRKAKIIDMSEFSDNLANGKFNGDYNQPAMVTGFVRQHPDGILIFDEIEKAHINAIHQFLQILDAARMTDQITKKEVSFKNNIIVMTTNAGKQLYDDPTVFDLSHTPRSVILNALAEDKDETTKTSFFPQCIITRMANGHVILFNHLEPYALMNIIKKEIAAQIELFEKSSGLKVEYEADRLAALVMYCGGGVSDARTLKGLARNTVIRELQELMMQLYLRGENALNSLKTVNISVNTHSESADVTDLFENRTTMMAKAFCSIPEDIFVKCGNMHSTVFSSTSDCDEFKAAIRGITDYILLDPLCGKKDQERIPSDIEDIDSDGMNIFNYVRDSYPDIPVYILNSTPEVNRSFETLIARGARGVITLNVNDTTEFSDALANLCFGAKINNATFSLGRSSTALSYNCAQYIIDDSCAAISFEDLCIKKTIGASDRSMVASSGGNDNIKFKDIIGCKTAKAVLKEYCSLLDNPRQAAISNKELPKGVLLYGPPGTGKTLLAKAMANECGATFIPTSATSFFASLQGETEGNIRKLFAKAKKYAPSVIFIDEVDAVARTRTGSIGSTHNEDALTELLNQMDGFVTDKKRPVFVLAATNYDIEGGSGRVLDPAFVRRFNKKILIPLPETEDRYELIKRTLEKHSISFGDAHESVLKNMAARTGGMNNADLVKMTQNYIDGLNGETPDGAKFLDSLDGYRFGDVRKTDPDDLRRTAAHEAGHALVYRLLGDTPSFLTIVSRGNFGGYMAHANNENKGTYSFSELMDLVCVSLAGRVGEIALYNEESGLNSGASNDIEKARHYVKLCLDEYAMGEKLFIKGKALDDACEKLLQEQLERTRKLISDNIGILEELTDLLVSEKSLDQHKLDEFFKSHNV